MAYVSKLNLVDISWPINILKCCKCMDKMAPGERLVVSLRNADTVESIVTLLKTKPYFEYELQKNAQCYSLTITRHPEFRGQPG